MQQQPQSSGSGSGDQKPKRKGTFVKNDPRRGRRPKGAKNKLTETKVMLMAKTGMMPLDFMTAVYRNQLYDEYDVNVADDGVTQYFTPKTDPKTGEIVAEKIDVTLQQRIICATNAAPYVHKKQPVGIEMGDQGKRTITADAIAKMPTEQIEAFLSMLDALGLKAEFEGFESPRLGMQSLDDPEHQ